jgi:hypothetical protein
MSLLLVGICLAAVVGLYYYNNPLGHGAWFMTRRFINWFRNDRYTVACCRVPERRDVNAS